MVNITEVFVLSLVLLDGSSSHVEFFLRPSAELLMRIILVKPRTSASSKLRWIFGMRCSTLCSSVAFPVTSYQNIQC